MELINKIKIDLLRAGVKPMINAMQADENSRVLEITLNANGDAWEIPDGVSFSVAYKKPDGTRGLYDTMPDGTGASSVDGNVVSIRLAPQMLTAPGTVNTSVVISSGDQRISTFPIIVNVIQNPAVGAVGSEDYFYSSVIGNLDDLKTTNKSSLVAAINEIFSTGGSGSNSGQNPTGGGLTTEQINALDGMFKVCVFDDSLGDVEAAYAAFKTAFGITDSGEEEPDTPVEPDEPVTPEITLSSISAVYSGGDVPVGTAIADLTGIVVTAHYSDGSSKSVTGYTLSGTIAEGSNTVTVSYGGKTTTFTVTGVAESGGETSDILYELAEPTVFDGTMSIDTGWNPLKEDQDFTIISKASLPDFTEAYGVNVSDKAIAGAYQYISGIYSLMIVVSNANKIKVEGVETGIYWNINSVAITHAKGSGVCSVKIRGEKNPDGTYGEKTGEFNYKGTSSFTDTMKIGYNGRQKNYLKGTVEKFVIYSRVLTAEEINAQLA